MRYFAIDAARTLAIVGMIIYHLAFDLRYFYSWPLEVTSGYWWLLARCTASLFLALVGISFYISNQKRTTKHMWKRTFERFCLVMGIALLISLVTYVSDPTTYIRFGILHCIASIFIILAICRSIAFWNVLLGLLCIVAGVYMPDVTVSTPLFIPFSLPPTNFVSLDYYPLLPWAGVSLIGYGLAPWILQQQNSNEHYATWQNWLAWPGKNALLIYLIHQPLLLGVLYLLLG